MYINYLLHYNPVLFGLLMIVSWASSFIISFGVVSCKSKAEWELRYGGRSELDDLNDDMASRNPKSSELPGEELCCLSKAKSLNAVTTCTFCLSTAKSTGVFFLKK